MSIVKKKLWQAKLGLQGNALKYVRQLHKWQWLSEEDVRALQQKQLTRLLEHAYRNIPYYSNVLKESGVIGRNGEIRLAHYSSVPLLDKSAIRTNFDSMQATGAGVNTNDWYENTSGGSTGEPVRFIQDKDYTDWGQAVKMLDDNWSGHSLGERKIKLWGSERDLFVGRESFKTRVGRFLKNELWLNSLHMSKERMNEYVRRINEFKPVQILSYAKSIYELARHIEAEGLTVYSPQGIMTSATTLYPDMRDMIERVFQTSVFNRYGSREVGDIACECSDHKGLHVSVPTHFVELLRSDGTPAEPGEPGEMVVTLLTNYAMPLIRYRIGDMAVWSAEKCTCGRQWPLLKEVTGRVTDVFVTREGTQVYGGYFTRLMLDKKWLEKFQVVQEDFDEIHIFIKLHAAAEDPFEQYGEEIKEITAKIKRVMGDECRLTFKFVDDIPPSPSGKYRYTISKVAR